MITNGIRNIIMAEINLTYERRDGIDSDHGVCFEWQTTNLAYLRCEKLHRQWVQDNTSGVKSYIVANNVDGIGAFDDVVIRAEYPHQNEDKTKLIFVQCKYFSNPKKCLLEKVLNRASVQKYFDSFIEVLRTLNDNRALSCQTYNEIKILKYTKKHRPQETAKNTEKENKLRSFFQCKPKDCEFIFYSNMILDSGFENTQTQQDNDISMKILNTARINEFNISLNAEQLEYLPNEQIVNEREIFVELKKEFAAKFRIIVNQADNINVDLLKSIIPAADIREISPLLEEEMKCVFQNKPCTAITENSELLENIENFCKLKTIAKNEMESFLHISEHGNLFSNESIENLQKFFENKALTKIYTSSIELEKLKIKQFVINVVQGRKLLAFIKVENNLSIWTKARKSKLYRNLDHIFVCLENMYMLSGFAKDTNEVFIEIHQNNDNDPSFYFAQFSDETSKLILNHAINFQGFTVTVKDICGDEWRRLYDYETICRILREEEITIGCKFFDPPDSYIERKLKLKETNDENSPRVNQRQTTGKSSKPETKTLTEDDIIVSENKTVFLLTGPAGIGKSTMLKSLALKYKNKNPKYFVYLIELNKYLNVLKKYEEDCDVSGAIEFLAQKILSLQQLEYRLFVYACADKKNVALFFDAFDEISPDGEEKFSSFLETLLKTNVSSIFVTSRPNFIGTLEKRLKQDSLIFEPLTLDDKNFFFLKYYEKLTTTNTTTNDMEEMENVISRNIKSMEKGTEFMAIPLQITMLAEILFEKFSDMTTEEKMSFSIKMDICSLYNAFIEKLVERYLVEKKKLILQDEEKIIAIRDKMRDAEKLACKLICPDINQTPLTEYSDAILQMCNQVGLITNIDPPVFLHRTYGEFLAASWFVQCIMNENKNSSSYVSFMCKNVLIEEEYREIRRFINAVLSNLNFLETNTHLVNPNVKILVHWEDGKTSLHVAAEEKHADIVKLLVRNDPIKLNEMDNNGYTAVEFACRSGCLKSVEILYLNNCQTKVKNVVEETVLHCAAKGNNTDIIQLILKNNYSLLTKTNCKGDTAFNMACVCYNLEAVMCLIKFDRGLVNIVDGYGKLPLHYAIEVGNIRIVKEFISQDKNLIDINCNDGLFPLHIACKHDHFEVAKYLLTQKSSMVSLKCGEKEETSLHFAARNGNKELMLLILQHDETLLNTCNLKGESPLICALLAQRTEAAKFLLKFPNCVVNTGENPLILAAKIRDIDILRSIHELDCTLLNKVGEKQCRGKTPLLCALAASNHKAAKFLLELPDCSLTVDLDQKSPLHYAAMNGNIEIIKLLINKDRSLLLKPDKNGNTALYFAIDARQTEVARILLSCKEYCVFVDENTLQNELEFAIRNDNFEIMTLILEHKSTLINMRNLAKLLPLEIACEWNNIEAVKYLLPRTDSTLILKGEMNDRILHIAARTGNLSVATLILEEFPTLLNQQDSQGFTAMHYACAYNKTEFAKLLHNDFHCETHVCDEDQNNPLHLASGNCNIDIMKMILERDTSLLNIKNKKGDTPLHLIIRVDPYIKLLHWNEFGEKVVYEAAKYLLSLKCSVNEKDENGQTPLHLASKHYYLEIVKFLIERDGTLLNQKDKDDRTPLHLACKSGSYETVNFFLTIPDCDITLTDSEGNTPLHHAVMFEVDNYKFRYGDENFKILRLFVQRDESLLNVTNKWGQTALHLAILYYCDVGTLRFLLKHMCKANVQDKYGDTPLHLLIKDWIDEDENKLKIFFFMKHDSSILNIKNNEGQTPLHIAVARNFFEVVELFVWLGAVVNIKDNEDRTPLELALEMRKENPNCVNKNIIDILQKVPSDNINN